MFGELGQGHFVNVNRPTKLNLPKIRTIDISHYKICAVTEDGQIFIWGSAQIPVSKTVLKRKLSSMAAEIVTRVIDDAIDSTCSDDCKYIAIPMEIPSDPLEKITDISIGENFIISLIRVARLSPDYCRRSQTTRFHGNFDSKISSNEQNKNVEEDKIK